MEMDAIEEAPMRFEKMLAWLNSLDIDLNHSYVYQVISPGKLELNFETISTSKEKQIVYRETW